MILYKAEFPLSKDVSFSRYIRTLDEMNFSPFVLLIREITGTKNYYIEIVITNPMHLWGLHSSYIGGVLLSDCTIRYSEEERHFTIQASIKTGNLVFTSIRVVSAVSFLILILSMSVIKDGMSLNNIFGTSIITFALLAPFMSTYLRDKKFLDKVGSIGKELEKM